MKIGIVGGGLAGLAAAALLAKRGYQVELLNQEGVFGGKMAQVERPHTTASLVWDTGPTLISLPHEIQGLFDELGSTGARPPRLIPLTYVSDLRFADGSSWKLPSGRAALIKSWTAISPKLGAQADALLDTAASVFAFAEAHLLHKEPPHPLYLGMLGVTSGLALKHPAIARENYLDFIQKRLSDPRAQEFFLHFASYVGVLPEHAGASLVSVAHVELSLPVVFPEGGVFRIAEFFVKAALAAGAQLNAGAKVLAAKPRQALSTNSSKKTAAPNETKNLGWEVQVEGELRPRSYDALIIAVDPHVSLRDWLDAPLLKQRWWKQLNNHSLTPTESQLVVLFEWENPQPLSHHTKLFPESFRKSYAQVYTERILPADPCIYLVWPHATDPQISAQSLFISAMAPNLLSGHTWSPAHALEYAQKVLRLAENRLGYSLRGRIVEIVTPRNLAERTGALEGGLYGAAPTQFAASAFQRPSQAGPDRLFFVGGGVHPGAGVPMVLRSAKRAVQLLEEQFKR